MRLIELIEGTVQGSARDIEITGLTADSREVRPGYLFAAMPGTRRDGLDYLEDAVGRGAAAVVARPDPRLRGLAIPVIEDADPRRRFALLAARFYGRQPRLVAAVTGTNGKTSVADFTRQIWERLGLKGASLGTLGVLGPGVAEPLAHTTPEPALLHRILADLAARDVEHLAIEASSHGLDQRRMDGVDVQAAAFTSFSRDHLDYHPDAESYLAAKLRLFDVVMPAGGTAVVNADMDIADRVMAVCARRGHRVLAYGAAPAAELRLVGRASRADGQTVDFEIGGRRHDVTLPLVGDFQAMNVLAALGLALGCGADEAASLAALASLRGVRGRLEHVADHPAGAAVYVDYAHTPDALEKALGALRPHTAARLSVVFGCGGDRDRGKRPTMGKIAARLADAVIVTDDNPRGEEPAAIRRDILARCPGAVEIGDRAEAIRAAVADLRRGDVLLIAGKGHEQGQIVGDVVRPFDDAGEAREAVAALSGGAP